MTNQEIKKNLEEIQKRLDALAKSTSVDADTGSTKADLADHKRIVDAYFCASKALWYLGEY